jgi:tRNA dimethylallyltransferase
VKSSRENTKNHPNSPIRINALNTVGYAELFDYLQGKCSIQEAVEQIKTNTRHYAKRQLTWFRKDPSIEWFSPDDIASIINRLSPISRDYPLSGK